MFCPQCGASNADLDRYCVACGTDMTSQAPGNGQAASRQGQYAQPANQQYAPQQYQQPPYQQAQYGSPPQQNPFQGGPYQTQYQPTPTNYGMPISLPTYLVWAIVTLILCFWPASVVAIVYGSQVNSKLARGDYNGALHSSRRARLWCWISFCVLIAGLVIAIIGVVVSAAVVRS